MSIYNMRKALWIIIKHICKKSVDFFFPKVCLICKDECDGYLCEKCKSKIQIIPPDINSKAIKPTNVDSTYVSIVYDEDTSKIIHRIKYLSEDFIIPTIGEYMVSTIPFVHFAESSDVIIPVPLHKWDRRMREFNQSEELAKIIAENLGKPMLTNVLVKIKRTRKQAKLASSRRRTNIIGAFSVKNPEAICGKKVILIDDVITTGATVNECAKTLKAAGACEVYAFVLASAQLV